MPRAPKNPNVERVAKFPFEKDAISPMPQITPRPRARGASASIAPPAAKETPTPSTARATPPAREEYPGPQTATAGTHLEPGRVHPVKRRER
jgi:hypothetical protein